MTNQLRERSSDIEEVAYRMFIRNVIDYAEPALAELAWLDPDIRQFWIDQATAVAADLGLGGADPATPSRKCA
jgi:hypothetical protein